MMTYEEFSKFEQMTYELLDKKIDAIRRIINAEGSIDIYDLKDKIEVEFANDILPDEFHNDIFDFIGTEELADYIRSRKIGTVEEVTTHIVYRRREKAND